MDSKRRIKELECEVLEYRSQLADNHREIEDLRSRLRNCEYFRNVRAGGDTTFRVLFDLAPVGFLLGDSSGRIIEANLALVKILGSPSVEETKRVNLLDFPPIQSSGFSDCLVKALASGKEIVSEAEYTSKWGRHLFLRTFIKPIQSPDTVEKHVLVVIEDISDKRKVIEALKASEERYRVVVETTQDVIYVVSLDGRVVSVNKALVSRTGWTEEDVIGKSSLSFIHPDEVDRSIENHRRFLEKPEFELNEFKFLCKNGCYIDVEFATAPLYQGEKLIGRFGIGRDITERKRAEEELLLAKQKAEAANQAKTNFLMTMSHELRTPLTVIHGNGSMLAGQLPEEKLTLDTVRGIGSQIFRNSQHLKELIEDILDFASIETGRLKIEPDEIDLREILSFIDALGRTQSEIRGVGFECVGCDLPISVFADPKIIRQILTNVLVNAFKFTNTGSVRLEIETNAASLELKISDTGIGIAQKHLERVYEPFYQVSEGRSRFFGGLGLGLAIVRYMVDEMHGTINITSAVGKGTCVLISLPGIVRTASRQGIIRHE